MENNKTVLCIVAHPDDAEFQCGGTLALLAAKGWQVVIATMTPGQAGSTELGPEEISAVRRQEAANAANILNGEYHCLECEDIFVLYDRPTLMKAIELIRKVKPAIVFTASPADYIVDHEVTSKVVQTACLAAGIPNITTPGIPPFSPIPVLYYCDPLQGKDILGMETASGMHVDISTAITTKEEMLCCHKSQRDWLLKISGVDEFVIMMKDYSRKKGSQVNCAYAEGFRQHLGFSYPAGNLLQTVLGNLVHLPEKEQ